MLNFRRRAASASRVEPVAVARRPPAATTTNAEKARALIAMLESGGAGAAIPPERLRDWARDLVETVERRPAVAKAAVALRAVVPLPEEPLRPTRLFSTAAPVLKDRVPVAVPRPAAAVLPDERSVSEQASRAATASRLTLTAPMPHAKDPAVRPAVLRAAAIHAAADVRNLIERTVESETIAREHPAVIAMTLAGKPPLEQASALRRLPSGKIRAVHRALRQIESASA